MKIFFRQNYDNAQPPEEELTQFNLHDSIEKTRIALEIAYAGFDNAVDEELIDSYIYEINSLLKKYQHLTTLASLEPTKKEPALCQHSAIRALVSHVFS